MAGDRPFAGGYGAGYSPVAADSGKPFKGDSAPAQQAIIVGGAPALSDAFYADEQVLSDGNKFNVPFFDNAGYVADDQGVIFDNNHKDKGYDHPSRLAVGGKPMAGDRPFAGGYGAGYSPVAADSGKPFKGDSAPAQQAIVIQGVPAADDEVYGDSSIVTDGGFMPAAFKGDGSYYGDHDGIVFADDHKDLGDFDSARLAVGGKPLAGDSPFADGYGAGYSSVPVENRKITQLSNTNAYTFISADKSIESSHVLSSNNTLQACPGINIEDSLPCPSSQVWDGRNCVSSEDCPCITEHNYYTSGSVWKENRGCTNCICIGGISKCTQEICDTVSCPKGYSQTILSGDCCPSCVPSDKTCESGTKTIGEVWTENCEECICLESGTQCSAIDCPQNDTPQCAHGYELVQKVTGCCPTYECVCDHSLCSNSTKPVCGENYEMVAINVDGACCPEYRCVCAQERCPSTYCKDGERKVLIEEEFDCCPAYRCEQVQCLDKNGVVYHAGDVFADSNDHCSECVCDKNGNPNCQKKTCPVLHKPKCRDNSEPVLITTENGCCPLYTCNCVCKGLSTYWTMFDHKLVSSSRVGTFTLVSDVATNDFAVTVERAECDSAVCLTSITIHDRVGNHVLKLFNNGKIEIDGENHELEVEGLIRKLNFIVENSRSEISVKSSTSGVSVSMSENGHSWSVSVPHTYQNQVTGLCGSCSSETCFGTEVEIGSITDATIDSFNLISGAPRSFMPLKEATIGDIQLCGEFMANQFASCSVDKLMYLGSCASYLSNGGTPCHALSSLANTCTTCDKVCVDWRNDELCPVECPVGTTYKACAQKDVPTCTNYKTISTRQSLTDGCFCNDNMVLLDGVCVKPSTCPVCVDESGKGRFVGESWTKSDNLCVTSTCTNDGNIVQMTAACDTPKTCQPNEITKTIATNTCCQVTECIPQETCKDVKCPVFEKPICGVAEEIQSIIHDECCVEFRCTCNSKLCPVIELPTCESGEVLVQSQGDECCKSQVCECKPETCPAAPSCEDSGFKLQLTKNGRCCNEYECVCDRASCPSVEQPVCSEGEKLQVVNPGQCCVQYQCVCDTSTCPVAVTECAFGYNLKKMVDQSKCCVETTQCECDSTQCPLYVAPSCDVSKGLKLVTTSTRWTHPKQMSCCPSVFEQVCTCDSSLCPLNEVKCESWEKRVEVSISSCCTQTRCECDVCDSEEAVCKENEHIVYEQINPCCKKSTCVCNECQEISITCKNGWITVEETDSCGCKHRSCSPPEMCVHNDESYKPGTTWNEDVCTECSCPLEPNSNGEFEAKCTSVSCGRCSSGYTYVPVPGACCGDCVPTTCHYDGVEHTVGQTWAAKNDTCNSCKCEMNKETGEVYTTCSKPSCAPLDKDCPVDKIRTTEDGCCQYCETEKLSSCAMKKTYEEMLTIDECTSETAVEMSVCEGACVSSSVYSFESGNFTRTCSCCHAQETEIKMVQLTCPDNSVKTVSYMSATQCGCRSRKCDDEL